MNRIQTFLLGALSAGLIVACSQAGGGGGGGSQTVKLDQAQLDQILNAIKKPQWEVRGIDYSKFKNSKLGAEGWEPFHFQPTSTNYTVILKRRTN
ncbi:MAG: hypothetical protein CMO74_15625 [Verrucomicrobiales bacterium]|nr:hypothetical protein [Verrucomicrobiales bacterium]|tara:strand:- start:1949 stop:2233 length:285 start_codon:yes stop_codon:yes gene_type:complete